MRPPIVTNLSRKVDFRNTIVIMTSNVGAEIFRKQGSIGFKSEKEEMTYKSMKENLLEKVKKNRFMI